MLHNEARKLLIQALEKKQKGKSSFVGEAAGCCSCCFQNDFFA